MSAFEHLREIEKLMSRFGGKSEAAVSKDDTLSVVTLHLAVIEAARVVAAKLPAGATELTRSLQAFVKDQQQQAADAITNRPGKINTR